MIQEFGDMLDTLMGMYASSPYRSVVRAVSQPFFAQMVVPYWDPYRPKPAVFVEKPMEEPSMDGCAADETAATV